MASCGNYQTADENLLNSITLLTENSLEQNATLTQNVNGIMTKLSFLKHDPQSRRIAQELDPYFKKIADISNQTDDYILSEINELISQKENWLIKDIRTQITNYKSLYSIPNRTTSSNLTTRGLEITNQLATYRDKLIIETFGNTQDRGRTYKITNENLQSFDVLSEYLKNQRNPQQGNILSIYQKLTQPAVVVKNGIEMDWNEVNFENHPLIGTIGILSSLRNDIRIAERTALKSLMERIDVPICRVTKVEAMALPISKVIKLGSNISTSVNVLMYDSSKEYNLKYKFNNKGDYIYSTDGTVKLNTKTPGLNHVEGTISLEIAGKVEEKNWSYDYIVSE